MEVMLGPLTTPSGITYEASLREHLQKVSAFDPVTRAAALGAGGAGRARAARDVREYLDEHPWAYESNLGLRLESPRRRRGV